MPRATLSRYPFTPIHWDTPWWWFISAVALILEGCVWLGWASHRPPGRLENEEIRRRHRATGTVRAQAYLVSENGWFLQVVKSFSAHLPPYPRPLSSFGWINSYSRQLSKISHWPHVAHIFRHSGNVLFDLYIPTPNRSCRQRWPAEQFLPCVIHRLYLPCCMKQENSEESRGFVPDLWNRDPEWGQTALICS